MLLCLWKRELKKTDFWHDVSLLSWSKLKLVAFPIEEIPVKDQRNYMGDEKGSKSLQLIAR